MSEGDVSLIRDEDLLRRMWQQTEDFSRKKEIRAHMYRLREERLRNLYSPDPTSDGKGCEFTSPQGHVQSFADQSFQSMKSKEVRDAGSPPKEFTYRGQDLKELSNAGWNVESENRTTDDGHTHVKSVHANIEGRYDVEGGKGQFAAVDHHKQAVTEYHDANSSLKRNESSSNTAAQEQVLRRTDDGTQFSSTTSSSTSSKYQQVSTKHETVPYAIDDHDQRNFDTNRNEQLTRRTHHETSLGKNVQENGELVSRKVEYPDDNTRVIVETRCLPDGTRVTSTRREFRAPVQSTRSEQRSQTRTESKYSTLQKSDQTSTSNVSRYTDNRVSDIVDSQRNVDDQDFRRQITNYTDNDDYSETQSVRNYETNVNRRVVDSKTDDNYSQTSRQETKINKKLVDHSNVDDYSQTDRYEKVNRKVINNYQRDDVDRKQTVHEVNKQHYKTDDSQTTRYVTKINRVSDYTTTEDDKHTLQRFENVDNVGRREIITPRGLKDSYPRDTYPKDSQPRDTYPKDSQPRDTYPKDSQPRDTYPKDSRPRDTYPKDSQPRDTYPKDSQPRDTYPKDSQPGDTYPKDSQPRDTYPQDSQPRDTYPKDSQPRDSYPNDSYPKDSHPRNTYPKDSYPKDSRPTDAYRKDTSPRDTSPRETFPKDSQPRDTYPTSPKDGYPKDTSPRDSYPKDIYPKDTYPRDTQDTPDKVERVHTITTDTDRDTRERVHIITRDKKEDVVTKKTTTDQYQTTYTTDYTQKKISTDWSPTHTAWASTLRADTPTTTRPSTRASSPGSRTFKSSTSSIRSSVSPDKKKPSSRGGSPNKIDRYSPSRTVSDRYTTTHSTHHVTETKTTKHTGTDGRPPTGRSPTRPGYSPDSKPHGQPRTGTSPEKKPHDRAQKPSASPERKPTSRRPDHPASPTRPHDSKSPTSPRQSPERQPTHRPTEKKPGDSTQHRYPSPQRSSPDRKPDGRPKDSSPTPDRRPGHQSPAGHRPSNTSGSPRTTSPTRPYPQSDKLRPSASPERKPTHATDEIDKPTHRKGSTPDIKPGYMQPTVTSKPTPDNLKSPTKPSASPDRKSPSKLVPDIHGPDKRKVSTIKEVHQTFVDEETKYYSEIDKNDTTHITVIDSSKPGKYSPQPDGKAPGQDTPDFSDTPRDTTLPYGTPDNFIPSDKKKPQRTDRTDVTTEYKEVTKEIRTTKPKDSPKSTGRQPSPTKDVKRPYDDVKERSPKPKDAPKTQPDREPSPSKYGTYEKKKPTDTGRTPKDEDTPSQTTREPSPSKFGTYDKKQPHDTGSTPKDAKGAPSRETSPTKYGTYDKKRPTGEAPKDLSKPNDKKTTVEKVTTIVTEDKETKYDSLKRREKITKKPEQPASPTKKSPRDSMSPVKSPVKDTKYKHTTDFLTTERTTEEINKKQTTKDRPRQLITPSSSPTRKPKPDTEPSTGQSSPTTSVSGFVYFGSPRQEQPVTDLDDQELYTNITTIDKTTKTYKISDNSATDRTPSPSKIPCRSPSPEKQTSPSKDSLPRKSSLKKPSDIQTSPSEKPPSSFRVSPDDQDYPTHDIVKKDCPEPEGEPDSPRGKPPLERRETYEDRCRKILGMIDTTETTTKITTERRTKSSPEESPVQSPSPKDSSPFKDYPSKKDNKINVTDFISREKEELLKTTKQDQYYSDGKPKTPRDTSPTKLQDIIETTKKVEKYEQTTEDIEKNTTTTVKTKSTRDSPERKPGYVPEREHPQPLKDSPTRNTPKTPKTIEPPESPKSRHSDSSPRDSLSPERKPSQSPVKNTQEKPREPGYPKESSPTRPGYMKSTITSTKHDTVSTEGIRETVTSVTSDKKSPSRPSDTPTRKPSRPDDEPRSTSPSKSPKNLVPDKKTITTSRKPSTKSPVKPEERHPGDDSETSEEVDEEHVTTTTTSHFDTVTSDLRDQKITLKTTKDTKVLTSTKHVTDDDEQIPKHPADDVEKRPGYTAPSDTIREPTKGVESKLPRDSSPLKDDKTYGFARTVTDTTKNIVNETVTSKLVTEKQPKKPSESPVRRTSDEPLKHNYPREGSPDKSSKPQQPTKPIGDAPGKVPREKSPRDVSPSHPEYLQTTTVISSTGSEYTVEDANDITITKTTGEKYPRKPSGSPTRREPDDKPKAAEPIRPRYTKEESPERKPGYQQPTKDVLKTVPGDKYPEDDSPVTHGKLKTTTVISSTDDRFTTEDVNETVISKTTRELYPRKPSDSPTRRSPEYKTESGIPTTPRYPKEGSPERKPGYQQPTKKDTKTTVTDFITHEKEELVKTTVRDGKQPTRRIPGDDYPEESPLSSGYIQTSTVTTTDNVYTSDDVDKTVTSRTVLQKYPQKPTESPTRRSPDGKPQTGTPTSPGYPTEDSPDKRPSYQQPTLSYKDTSKGAPEDTSPSRPGYVQTTTIVSTADNQHTSEVDKTLISNTTHEKYPHRALESPTRRGFDTPRKDSPSRPGYPKEDNPERKPGNQQPSSPTKNVPHQTRGEQYPEDKSPSRPSYSETTTTTVVSSTDNIYTTEDDEYIHTSKTIHEKYPRKPSVSPTRKPHEKPRSDSPSKFGYPRDDSLEKIPDRQRPTSTKETLKKTPGEVYPDDSTPSRPGKEPSYARTKTGVTRIYTTDDVEENFTSKTVKESYPRKPAELPTRRTPDDKPRTDSLTKPKDDSPERMPTKGTPITQPDKKHPDSSSPMKPSQIPGYMKSTTAVTSKQDSHYTTKDTEETVTSKMMEPKYPRKPESPTKKVPGNKTDSTAKPRYPKEESPERRPGFPRSSPTKETPTKTYTDRHLKETTISHTEHLKTDTAYTSENYSTTEDVAETVISKTVHEKFPRKLSESPTRRTLEDKPRTESSTQIRNVKEDSPERTPGYQYPSSPKDVPRITPEDKYPKDSSPTRTGKYPAVSRFDTYTIEDSEDTRITELVEEHYPRKSTNTPTRVTPGDRLRNTSPTKPSHPKDESPERKPGQQRHTSPTKSQKDVHPKDTTSPRQPKTPGYMRTTTSASTKHDTSVTTEDIEKTYTTKSIKEKYPTKPSELSPSKSRDSSPDLPSPIGKTPQKKPQQPQSKEPSPTKDNKIPSYMKTTTSSKYETVTTEDVNKRNTAKTHPTTRPSESPSRRSPDQQKKMPEFPKNPSQVGLERPSERSPARSSPSPDRKPLSRQTTDSGRDSPRRTPDDRRPHESSPTRSDRLPGYMKTTTTVSSKYDVITKDDVKTDTSRVTKSRTMTSPTRQILSPTKSTPECFRPSSPSRPGHRDESPRDSLSPERKPEKQPQETIPGYMRTTTSVTSKYDTISSVDIDESSTTRTVEKKQSTMPELPLHKVLKDAQPYSELPKNVSPGKPSFDKESPLINPDYKQPYSSGKESPKDKLPTKQPGIKKPGVKTTKYETTSFEDSEEYITTEDMNEFSIRRSGSPSRRAPEEPTKPGYLATSQETRQLRTPSPIKKITEVSTDFILTEREQEVLDKVQKSLRKLSPERKEKSPVRERSPTKTTTSLYDLDIKQTAERESVTKDITETTKRTTKETVYKPKEDKPKDQRVISKPMTRNESPTKKPGQPISPKVDKSPESPTKTRSTSPRKPFGERPQSPQMSKTGIIRKEPTPSQLIRKPTPVTITTSKVEKAVTTDVKKLSGTAKQITKTTVKATASKFMSSATKTEPEIKRAPTPKAVKDSTKKDIDSKVTRTVSDIIMKNKKSSPQRIKSKPEIQVSDMSSTKSPKSTKPTKEPQTKFNGKPKSATALNTSVEEDDIIIDVQQSKSSRENSPDRICPTPVNFSDDVGTPRFPDQVSEPDDELRKRTYHTIHEAESIVDDIVEICEDDELFVKRTDVEDISDYDESQLSVHDKVSKFTTKIQTTPRPKDSTTVFKDTEMRVHSDFTDEKLKSDECLLSVSEKVNKFAKGPRDPKDSKSPTRKIFDEYDRDTIYQDDYTKLSVNDKAHLFVETAEHAKAPKVKPAQKVERPDLTDVDESLKTDDCLLSVSDKVNKFVKTAEQFLTESHEVEEKDKKIKEQHDKIMRQIVDDSDDDTVERTEYTHKIVSQQDDTPDRRSPDRRDDRPSFARETTSSHAKVKEHDSPNTRPSERTHPVKITTLRSSEAVKKAKALFENIASTTHKTKETHTTKTAKLIDIGVQKKPKDSTVPHHHEGHPSQVKDIDSDVESVPHIPRERPPSGTHSKPHDDKTHSSPNRVRTKSPEIQKAKSPMRQTVETTTTTKTVLTRYPAAPRSESPKQRLESDKPDKVPGYLRPTKTSQNKEEKVVEETETVSSRRGSGKFGVELRRTSVERSTASSERRRSVEHPCIEDIYDLDLLEQMLEKVVGYEQRRRIRAQIRVAKKAEDTHTVTKVTKTILSVPKSRSPERHKSPERTPKTTHHKTTSPERKSTPQRVVPQKETPSQNGHPKESVDKHPSGQRAHSPDKPSTKTTKAPIRQPSPDKKTRTQSPGKVASKPKSNRFNEYASAYMKKVGLNETDKKATDIKKKTDVQHKTVRQVEETTTVEQYSTSECFDDKAPTEVTEVTHVNGKRSPSPDKRLSPERKAVERQERSPTPELKRQKSDTSKRETLIKTVYDIEKKIPQKQVQEEKPSWVTSRNLKKVTSETRTFSTKKMEPEKPKYRSASPSKVITKPIDVITSSYGPGPLDADGKPLFGIKALRNGSSNYQVKGTVIRQEFHSRNGGEPEGTVSVTAYSTEPEELEKLLQTQGAPPSRIHGLAAITTTKKFGGDTGTTIHQAHGKEERAALDQFTHSDRRVIETIENVGESRNFETRRERLEETSHIDREDVEELDQDMRGAERIVYKQERVLDRRQAPEGRVRGEEHRERGDRRDDKKTVRQSSVKSLTEKYIKSASESSKDRSTYPKAGLILRTATMKDSVSSDSSAHAGLTRTDSEHSLGSGDDTVVTTTTERVGDGTRTTTTTTTRHHERSFLDSNAKVTGVQDILTRMKNADIVIQEGDTTEDSEARALLNKFLGATVLMAGMQGYVTEKPTGKIIVKQETVRSSSGGGKVVSTRTIEDFDVDQCWDERVLRKLLDECTDYEQRRRLRARIRTLMAEQEACTSAVTEALAAAGESTDGADGSETREEEEVTVTSSMRRNSSEKTVSSSTTTKTSKVIESMSRPAPKPVSPFAKFRQLEKQNSTNSPNSPKSPQSPGSPSQPFFKFTEPALQASALTIKERLLQWCRDKTRDYENVKLENFSTSWADGLAFCALVHHFLPDAFDYSQLSPDRRRHNFTLAFKVADEKAGIDPLLDVDDMVAMRKPDWKCVFVYVQAIHRRFKDHD